MAKKRKDVYKEVMESGIITLEKPFTRDEKEYTVLEFPIKKLNGQHLRTAERNYQLLEGEMMISVPELSKSYDAYVAAALMGVSPDFVFDLNVVDFSNITYCVQTFLLSGDS